MAIDHAHGRARLTAALNALCPGLFRTLLNRGIGAIAISRSGAGPHASLLGTTLGGLIVGAWGWRWIVVGSTS